ncbi:MAG: PIG-L family deacetylase, partial [Acidobacteria bacterium]|nr:PIG-L family deacetylase [Acidobacteriota bacterium]
MDHVLPEKMGQRTALVFVLLAAWFAPSTSPLSSPARAEPNSTTSPGYLDPLPQDTGVAGLKQELRRLENTGRLMMVVAHPDDEDGGLLTLESRGKGVATLLLTLTRGEGGQNKTGDTFSDQLGILRTLELLAAGRYYGVEQRFTRAADFGYSKTAEETFEKWGGHDPALQDIVRVIREFRPDVLVARFSGTDADGHGHHQASAILTKEAFRAAGDPARFPDQIRQGLESWQAKKLYIGNVCGFGASNCPDENWTVKLNTGEEDPLLGMSYVQFAIEGLRHQQSQGLGDLRTPSGPRYAFYKLSDSVLGKTADANGHEKDFFDGIDTRLQGLGSQGGEDWAGKKLDEAAARISDAAKLADGNAESAARPLLSALRLLGGRAPGAPKTAGEQTVRVKLEDKERQARRAINLALRVQITATLTSPPTASGDRKDLTGISPGEPFQVKVSLHNGSEHPLELERLALDSTASGSGALVEDRSRETVGAGEDFERTFALRLPELPYTRPGLYRNDPQRDSLYTVRTTPDLSTLPFGALPPAIVEARYDVPDLDSLEGSAQRADANLPEISSPVSAAVIYPEGVSRRQKIAVVPAFSVAVEPGNEVVRAATSQSVSVSVRVRSNLEGRQAGRLGLQAPAGWNVSPREQTASVAGRGGETTLKFELSHPALTEKQVDLRAVLSSGGREFSEGYALVTREDLGSFHYFEPARQHISVVDVKL